MIWHFLLESYELDFSEYTDLIADITELHVGKLIIPVQEEKTLYPPNSVPITFIYFSFIQESQSVHLLHNIFTINMGMHSIILDFLTPNVQINITPLSHPADIIFWFQLQTAKHSKLTELALMPSHT